MEVEAYVQARYGRLLEHAVELGAPEGEAAEYVDHVLLQQRRRISRAADPDPLVREALARAINGKRDHGRDLMAMALVLAGVLVLVGGAALVYSPPPKLLPSVFALDGPQAQAVLEAEGFAVQLRPTRSCDPTDLVVGTEPRAGESAARGATVTVRTAVPTSDCAADYGARSAAWEFLAFATGGAAPVFADSVQLVVDGEARATLTDPEERGQWGPVLGAIDDAGRAPARTASGLPTVRATTVVPRRSYCGFVRPSEDRGRPVVRIAVDPSPDASPADCPLTVDLYHVGDVAEGPIDAVVVYTAVVPG